MTTDVNTLPADHPDRVNTAPVVAPIAPVVAPVAVAPVVAPVAEVPSVDVPAGNYGGGSVLETSLNIFSAQTGVGTDKFEAALAGALKHNDVSLINFELVTAGLKPDQAAQAKALVHAAFTETQGAIQRGAQEAHTLAGGQAQWNEATAAFNTHAPAHIKAVVKTMLESGDVKNAASFVLETVRGAGMISNGTPEVHGSTGAVTQGLTNAEFTAQLGTLMREAGNRSFESGIYGNKYQALVQARDLGRKQGR